MSKKILLLGTLISAFLTAGILCAHKAREPNLFSADAVRAKSQISKLPPGFFAINNPGSLPLPTSGYRIYLMGEAHGHRENEVIFLSYLSHLYKDAGLRDVVLEEDQVYDEEAQAFVQGRRNDLPEGLCLRANILEGLRKFNLSLSLPQQIRVHLVDIDSPAQAIRQHILHLMKRVGKTAEDLKFPGEQNFNSAGMSLFIEQLRSLTSDTKILSELRTVKQSLLAYDDGFRVHTGDVEGNSLHPDREEAITENILDLLKTVAVKTPVLGLYGEMHIRKGMVTLHNPPIWDHFTHVPMASRLEKAGIKVYRFNCYPLSGSFHWRWGLVEMRTDKTEQFRLGSGDTLPNIFKRVPDCRFLYVDFSSGVKMLQGVEEFSRLFDSCLFIRKATPIESRCPSLPE